MEDWGERWHTNISSQEILSRRRWKKIGKDDDAGLRMEVRHGRVFINSVEGLFRERFESRGLPVLPGDQLLEFNGKEYWEYRNLKEIRRVHDEAKKIWLKVKRLNLDDPSDSTDSLWKNESSHEEDETNEYVVQPGNVMLLQGLVNKPELNGETATIIRQVKGKADRWQVALNSTGKIRAFPSENLVPVRKVERLLQPGDIMMLKGLSKKPELNGEKVEAVRPVVGKAGRWQVKVLKTGKGTAVAEENLVAVEEVEKDMLALDRPVQPGVTMILQGLKKKADLNGKYVEIIREVHGKPDRWQVKVIGTGKITVVSTVNLNQPDSDDDMKCVIKPGAIMAITDMTKKPELNGERVEVLRQVIGKQGKWQVKVIATGKILAIAEGKLTA